MIDVTSVLASKTKLIVISHLNYSYLNVLNL